MLPVLPILLAGGASGGRRRPYAIVAGLVTSFTVFTLFATWLLRQLHLPQDFLRNLSIALLFLVAATLIFPQVGVWSSGRSRASAAAPEQRPRRRLPARREPRARLRALRRADARRDLGERRARATSAGRRSRSRSPTRSAPRCRCSRSPLGGQRATRRIRDERAGAADRRSASSLALAALALVFDADTKLQTWFPDYTDALQERSSAARSRATSSRSSSTAASRASTARRPRARCPTTARRPTSPGSRSGSTRKPLTLQQLRGKVVLVDFWTYSCINCLRTLPHLEAWDKRYRKDGLVIVGVHTPEFAFEHVPSNVREAVARARRPLPGRDRQRLRDVERVPERRTGRPST